MAEPAAVIPAHEKYGLPLAVTPDGETLLTGGFDGTVKGWAVGDWAETNAVAAHEQSVNDGAVTATGNLVTGSTDTTVRVWDLAEDEPLAVLEGHTKTVAGLAAHPTRPLVASASYDSTVRLWDVESATTTAVLEGHSGNVTSVEFVGTDDKVAAGGIGDELLVWSLDADDPVARLGGHGAAVAGVARDADSSLWTVGHDGTVHQWAPADWTERSSFDLPPGTEPNGIAVHPSADRVAVAKAGGTLLLDSAGGVLADHETSTKGNYAPTWTPDGRWLAVGGADGNVRLYD